MKLDAYTASKIQEQIASFLFLKWLKSKRTDWHNEELVKLFDDYHRVMNEHFNVVD